MAPLTSVAPVHGVLEALSSLTARLHTSDPQASALPQRPQPRVGQFALSYLDCLFATRALFNREPSCVSPSTCISSTCISPQNHNPTIHHRARSVDSAHRRPPRKLARLHNQPVHIVTGHKASRGDRDDFGAAPRASSLNFSNLVSIQQHPVTPAPSSKRSDLAAYLNSQPGPYSLLYCHGHITF